MKTWVKLLIATAVFWAVWIGIAGLAMVIHGDCGVAGTSAEIASCVREKGRVGIAAMAIGGALYGLMVWQLARRSGDAL